MKDAKKDLQSIAKELKALQKKVEKALAMAGKADKPRARAASKSPKKATAAKKAKPARKAAARKGADSAKQKIMMAIKRLRKNGKSYGEITKYLESKNIPTFSGKGKWHAQTIANLLKAA